MTMLDRKITVLYVDDEVGNLTAFKATFRRDFQVHTASSAEEGLALLAQHAVHIVISDQRMPGVTGSQFLATVKDRYPRTMRMLLTGYSDIEAVVEAINKGGIYCYCTKPWDPNDLKLRIEQAFEVHALRDQRENLVQRYRQVFERSGDPVMIIDPEGKLVEGNPAATQLLGVSAERIRGADLLPLLEKPEQLTKALAALADGRPFMNVDITLRSPSGHTIDCLLTLTALSGGDGRPMAQAMIKDISDRSEESQRLRKLNDDLDKRVNVRTRQLLDALEDLGSFSYTVAHDLRSPLKNMMAMSAHLKEGAQADPTTQEIAERIERGSGRMLQLVDDLLRFSQTNSRAVQRQDIDVRTFLQRCMEAHVPEDLRPAVQVDADATEPLFADPAMLDVALGNLIGNALKYSRDRADRSVVIGHRVVGGTHELWVSDNGIGFDAGKGDQAFGLFKRLHADGKFEGTGVGLAIVQRIVNKHGGTARAESEPGKGTTITIAIPSGAGSERLAAVG